MRVNKHYSFTSFAIDLITLQTAGDREIESYVQNQHERDRKVMDCFKMKAHFSSCLSFFLLYVLGTVLFNEANMLKGSHKWKSVQPYVN